MASITHTNIDRMQAHTRNHLVKTQYTQYAQTINAMSRALLNNPLQTENVCMWVNHSICVLEQTATLDCLPTEANNLFLQLAKVIQSELGVIATSQTWTEDQAHTIDEFIRSSAKNSDPNLWGPFFPLLASSRETALCAHQVLNGMHTRILRSDGFDFFLECSSEPFTSFLASPFLSREEKSFFCFPLYHSICLKEKLDLCTTEAELREAELELSTLSSSCPQLVLFSIILAYLQLRVALLKWKLRNVVHDSEESLRALAQSSFKPDPRFPELNKEFNLITESFVKKIKIRAWIEIFKKAEISIKESFPLLLTGEKRLTTGYDQWELVALLESLDECDGKTQLIQLRSKHLASLSELTRFITLYKSLMRKLSKKNITALDLEALNNAQKGIYREYMKESGSRLRTDAIYEANLESARLEGQLATLEKDLNYCTKHESINNCKKALDEIQAKVTRIGGIIPVNMLKKDIRQLKLKISSLFKAIKQ